MKMLAHLALVALASVFATGPAAASDDLTPVNFRYNASELASDEGAGEIYARMKLRARKKCDPRGEYTPQAREECSAKLVSQWVEAIDDPRTDRIHEDRGRES